MIQRPTSGTDWGQFVNWGLVLPPNRPAPSTLGQIRATAARYDRRLAVGVLGATPEFRDLYADLGFTTIYVFERSLPFLDLMRVERAYSNDEIVVEGDWLETLHDRKWDLALLLSDLTLGNIAYEDRDLFFSGVRNALSDSGLFVDRVLAHERSLLRLDELDQKYQLLPSNLQVVNDFSSEYLFCSELLSGRETVDSSAFYDLLDARFANPSLKYLRRKAELVTPRGCTWYYGRPFDGVAHGAPSLVITEAWEESESSVYHGWARTYVSSPA